MVGKSSPEPSLKFHSCGLECSVVSRLYLTFICMLRNCKENVNFLGEILPLLNLHKDI